MDRGQIKFRQGANRAQIRNGECAKMQGIRCRESREQEWGKQREDTEEVVRWSMVITEKAQRYCIYEDFVVSLLSNWVFVP